MSSANKLIWLGASPIPPPEPRFLTRFQWRHKKFRPHTLPVHRINMSSQASAETVADMRKLVDNLPPFPARALAQYGVAALAVHHLWDDLWFMLGWGVNAHGYNRTDGYDYVGGICLADGHLAVVSETVRVRDQGWQDQENLVGIMWHELGHSFDHALDYYLGLGLGVFSQSPIFRAAWLADTEKLTGSYRSQFAYYLQPDGRGESEAYAECFAVALGRGCQEGNTKSFPIYFPRCLELMRTLIAGTGPVFASINT